jgi:hypothetical protein
MIHLPTHLPLYLPIIVPWVLCGACVLIYRLANANEKLNEIAQREDFIKAMERVNHDRG